VLIPIPDIEDLYVVSTDTKGAIILGNESSLEKLENILTVAATNKDSIIFIPSRKNELTEYLLNRWSNKDIGNDIVILHHTIQFKTNDWKAIRNLIRKSKNENTEEIIVVKEQEESRSLSKYCTSVNRVDT
jgi:CDP-glycerol glycerophosphotransferase (TagB/SpsB family)